MQLDKIADPRPIWDKFRRIELYAICSQEGIKISNGAPATTMRRLLMDANVDPYRYAPQSRTMKQAGEDRIRVDKEKMPKPQEPLVEEEVIEVKTVIEDVNIETLKMHELRTWCKEHGIKPMPRDTKKVLIEKAKARINGENAT